VLYVGKASNLEASLASYKRPGGDGRVQIQFLSEEARAVETIVFSISGLVPGVYRVVSNSQPCVY